MVAVRETTVEPASGTVPRSSVRRFQGKAGQEVTWYPRQSRYDDRAFRGTPA
jgi:hypothetical protein